MCFTLALRQRLHRGKYQRAVWSAAAEAESAAVLGKGVRVLVGIGVADFDFMTRDECVDERSDGHARVRATSDLERLDLLGDLRGELVVD